MLKGLNPQQLQAVTSTSPVILCLAGAGSGKTTVLTRRISHLFNEHRIGTTNMLALTFTRLAGKEMKERVIKLIGEEHGKQLFCGTFHAFCVSVLKRWGHKIGLDQNFTIYDQEDREEILKRIITEFGSVTTVKRILEVAEFDIWPLPKYVEEARVHKEYLYRLKQNNAIDLDRLIIEVYRLWNNHSEALIEYQQNYTHVFVDEFQDTSDDQMRMLQLLKPKNFFVVGDDFQAIYGWRRAKVEYILNFPDQYPDCEVIKLEDNYRSTEQVVSAANKLIKHNTSQTEKILIAHKSGADVLTFCYENATQEAITIAKQIEYMHQEFNVSYKDIAVLARTNDRVDSLCWHLEQKQIPAHRVAGRDDPYKAPTVRPIIDWMYFLYNLSDDIAAKKIIRGKVTALKVTELEFRARGNDMSLYEAIVSDYELREITNIVNKLLCIIVEDRLYSPLEHFTAIRETLELQTLNDMTQAENAIFVWEKSKSDLGENYTVQAFLKYLRYRDVQEKLIEERDAVKVMTIHASKGLEFDTVFIAGMNQGVFPSKRGDLEEERRLFYVALTRAKNRLYITHPMIMNGWNGSPIEALPSQFLGEIS
ncbi:ATP-dependent helicase [Pelosinus sp. sgz500959]|uniref:ATP-dependent helicase n=1 Tax=Pelosinus sp. sgz500959 TaxID=3242472 RepID=UPI003671C45F